MVEDFCDFISASPSSFHAAHTVARRLDALGFQQRQESEPWSAQGGNYIIRGGALVAWWVPEALSDQQNQAELSRTSFRIIGSHTDSPGFKLNPFPDHSASGWKQVGVEIYGGPILSSWFDRELSLAGVVTFRDGSSRLIHTDPLVRIANVAIHLDRDPHAHLDRQQHIRPLLAVDGEESIWDMILPEEAEEILSHDLITIDSAAPAIFGPNKEFIAAGRMDNLSSVWASLRALERSFVHQKDVLENNGDIIVLAAFDHEEIGSATAHGAAGPLLEDVLRRTTYALGADFESTQQIYRRSTCISADAAHSLHPNYVNKHEPEHQPLINHGPVLKINKQHRYASTASTSSLWLALCEEEGVPNQVFVGRNDVPCGSTIGPITATRIGIDTVDVGVPLLSMHSAREMAGVKDMELFAQVLTHYWLRKKTHDYR